MKPQTAANKLGIYLPATPADFQASPMTRDEVEQLREDPPEWLVALRRTGPFPRDVVAQKLGVSRAGLARADVSDAMDADQIGGLLAAPPPWLLKERRTHAEVLAEKERIRDRQL